MPYSNCHCRQTKTEAQVEISRNPKLVGVVGSLPPNVNFVGNSHFISKEPQMSLSDFLEESSESHAREEIFNFKLLIDLKVAAAVRNITSKRTIPMSKMKDSVSFLMMRIHGDARHGERMAVLATKPGDFSQLLFK